jgi:hypothetical protein
MANHVTNKTIQEHISCSCEYNCVDQITAQIKYKDLSKAGIKRKICRTSGKPFLLWCYQVTCDGSNHFEE